MAHFLSCDWGTSRFRLRLIERDGFRIVAEHGTDDGIQTIAAASATEAIRRERLATVLERGLDALQVGGRSDVPVVISGMASSTLGWQSLPYAELPAPIDGRTLRFLDFKHGGRKVRLVSGLRADSDVMRGEETEVIGLFADPARRSLAENSVLLLPGTHSKHVRMQGGEIVGFTTFLTGELYGLLGQNSTLSVAGEAVFDEAAFVAGAQASANLGLSAALFQTRARTVLGQLAAQHSRAFLSGALIGAEIAALAGASVKQVVLAAGEHFAGPYALAIQALRPEATVVRIAPAEMAAATVKGHAKILALP